MGSVHGMEKNTAQQKKSPERIVIASGKWHLVKRQQQPRQHTHTHTVIRSPISAARKRENHYLVHQMLSIFFAPKSSRIRKISNIFFFSLVLSHLIAPLSPQISSPVRSICLVHCWRYFCHRTGFIFQWNFIMSHLVHILFIHTPKMCEIPSEMSSYGFASQQAHFHSHSHIIPCLYKTGSIHSTGTHAQ